MGGFGLTFYLGTQLASSTPTVPVLIAAHDIQAGSTIAAADLTTKKYLSDSAPKSVLHSTSDALGLTARVDIVAGDPILASMLGTVSQSIAPVVNLPVPPGYVAAQVTIALPLGIVAGEFVDILSVANLSLFKAGAAGNVSRVVFKSLEILRVSNPSSDSQQARVAIVLLDQCDLPYADWLVANTTLSLVVLPVQQAVIPPADTTCPGLVTDRGVGAAEVDARYHFSS